MTETLWQREFWRDLLRPDSPLWNPLNSLAILLGFMVAAFGLRLIWIRLFSPPLHSLDEHTRRVILDSTRRLAFLGLLMTGAYMAASDLDWVHKGEKLPLLLDRGFSILWAILILWTALRIFNGVTTRYVHLAARRTDGVRDVVYLASIARRIVNVLVLAIGLLYVLRAAGIDISPLLASGAIGGLAVALALQDTFSNLFAGFLLTVDRPVKVGDFIKLESGQEGFIEEIGWRNAKVRLLANALVILPNSKLSQSIITNFDLPAADTSVNITCGVAYDSDLEQVEEVAVEVAREVMARVDGADEDWEPLVRWQEFGDSAITFLAILRVTEIRAQYLLRSEYIKALHRRFNETGIEIPFPMRTVVFKGEFPMAESDNSHRGKVRHAVSAAR